MLPVIQGIIDRRLLVNFRCNPHALQQLLPHPFRPKLVEGHGVAGICLIRLQRIRPRGLPGFIGIGSENAAHRVAIEWTGSDGTPREGVFIPRRDTSSRVNHLLGGRFFPGVHHHATFDVREDGEDFHVGFTSDDGRAHVRVTGRIAEALPAASIFRTVAEVSAFFQAGSVGFSPRHDDALEGLELRTRDWKVTPLEVRAVESSFFDDLQRFPRGSAVFDNALLMRNIAHEWHAHPPSQMG